MLERFNLRVRLWEIGVEYRKSGKKGKAALLDKYIKRTRYNRKHLAEGLHEKGVRQGQLVGYATYDTPAQQWAL